MKSNHKLLALLMLLLFAVTSAWAEEERLFRAITASDGLADNSAQTIRCTKTGRMTITTIGNINFYDGSHFTYVNTGQEDKYRLEEYLGHYHLYYDNQHHLWLKGSHNVACVNLTTERFVANMDSLFQVYGMTEKVLDMFIDIDGNLWLMGRGYLYCKALDCRVSLDGHLNLQDMEVLDKKELFLFYSNGQAECYDLATGKLKYRNTAYGEADAAVYFRSSVQKIWKNGFFQIRNGEKGALLLFYDAGKRTWKELMRTDYHLNNMALRDDVLYIASEWGYFTYDIATGESVHHKRIKLTNGRWLETDMNAVEFDRQGGMWIGTEKRGLLYARPANTPFHALTWDDPEAQRYGSMMEHLEGISEFGGKKATVMLIDSRRWTWVGTSAGLYLYTSPQSEPVLYSRNNGLLNNVIHAIIEDNQGNVWVNTSYGITCLQVVGDKVKYVHSFNDADGVPNETFIDAKAMKLADGTIVMQALDHVVTFNPAAFKPLFEQKAVKMLPKLTRLMVNGVDVSVGTKVNGDAILEKAITRTGVIDLNYDQNSVVLTFSALNFAWPLQTYYRVRIKELDAKWKLYSYFASGGQVDSRGLLHLPLAALKPGTYHIELQASNKPDQFFEDDAYTWVINVNEPWWRTTGVLMAFGLILLVLLVLNFLLYNRNTRLRMERNNQEGDVIHRIQNFVARCDDFSHEVQAPDEDEIYGDSKNTRNDLSEDFIVLMRSIIPFVRENKNKELTMRMLCEVADVDIETMYEVISADLYKNPRVMARILRLQDAEEKLRTTDLSIEAISLECGFSTPNFFIANFYHQYKMTPKEYRRNLKK